MDRSPNILIEKNAIRDLADELEHLVIGCDSRVHLSKSEVSDQERETEDVISRYNGTPEKPHLAIIGGTHCLPSSYLNHLLQQREMNYTLIIGLVGCR